MMKNDQIIQLAIFFITFNPVLIGLIISFSYNFSENLKTNLFNIIKDNPKNRSDFDEWRKKIYRFTELSDRIIFNAGLFWLMCIGIGIIQMLSITKINLDVNCLTVFFVIVYMVLFRLPIIFIVLYKKIKNGEKLKKVKTNSSNDNIENPKGFHLSIIVEIIFWIIPIIFDISVLIIYQKANHNFIVLLITLLSVSLIYLLLWFYCAMLFNPTYSLLKANEKAYIL